jgi:phosphate/sulfate permease
MLLNIVMFIEKPMSNSMSLEKIFIIIAIILGVGSAVDLIYALASENIQLAEVLRCILNIFIAGFLYLYFNKKHKAKVED